MSTDNRTLIQKADFLLSELAAGGLLEPAQADQFIRLAIKEPVMMREVQVTPMTTPSERRDKMRFASRVLKPGNEAAGLALAQRSVPALGFVTLDTKLYRAETRMSDEVLEDQIERGAFKQTVMQELSRAVARDMEQVAVNGDTASADSLLATQDGWVKLASANLVDAGVAQLSKAVLRNMLQALPDEFTDIPNLRYYTNFHAQVAYADSLADRATALGDRFLFAVGAEDPAYSRVAVRAVPEFPDNLGVGTNETVALLTDPKNLVMGIQRNIKLETQRDAPAGVTIIVISVRFAVNIIEISAVSKATRVLGI